jgi:hypothetical protein
LKTCKGKEWEGQSSGPLSQNLGHFLSLAILSNFYQIYRKMHQHPISFVKSTFNMFWQGIYLVL